MHIEKHMLDRRRGSRSYTLHFVLHFELFKVNKTSKSAERIYRGSDLSDKKFIVCSNQALRGVNRLSTVPSQSLESPSGFSISARVNFHFVFWLPKFEILREINADLISGSKHLFLFAGFF